MLLTCSPNQYFYRLPEPGEVKTIGPFISQERRLFQQAIEFFQSKGWPLSCWVSSSTNQKLKFVSETKGSVIFGYKVPSLCRACSACKFRAVWGISVLLTSISTSAVQEVNQQALQARLRTNTLRKLSKKYGGKTPYYGMRQDVAYTRCSLVFPGKPNCKVYLIGHSVICGCRVSAAVDNWLADRQRVPTARLARHSLGPDAYEVVAKEGVTQCTARQPKTAQSDSSSDFESQPSNRCSSRQHTVKTCLVNAQGSYADPAPPCCMLGPIPANKACPYTCTTE